MFGKALKCLVVGVGAIAYALMVGAAPQPSPHVVTEHPGPSNLGNITGIFDTEALVFNAAGTKGYIIHVARDDNAFVTELTVPNTKGGTCELGVLKGPRGSHAVAYDEANARLWVGNFPEGNVSVVDLSQPLEKKCTIVATIPVNDQPTDVLYDATGKLAYVSGLNTNSVFVLGRKEGDKEEYEIKATWDLSASCQAPNALATDGKHVYLVCSTTYTVLKVDKANGQVVATTALEAQPVDVTLWGGQLYAAVAGNDSIAAIASDTMQSSWSVRIAGRQTQEPNPRYTAVSPDGRFVYSSNAADQSVSVVCRATGKFLESFRAIEETRILSPGVLKALDYKGDHLLYVPDKGGILQVFVVDVLYIKYEKDCP